MNILCITHADFESPGVIENWAHEQGYQFTLCKPYQGENCLVFNFDLLIVMGGPQSPLEIEKAPYLKDEITLISKAVLQNKIILGFCLGAQLIGEALGAKTEKSPEKEVGVFPIFLTPVGKQDPILQNFPSPLEVIHWHNDMPGMTQDAEILAYSEGCPRQIIRYANRIYGFQCHLEIPLVGIKEMIDACPQDLKASRFTQSEEQLLQQNYHTINEMMFQILNKIIRV